MKMSPRLASHIKEIKTSQNECEVVFENGSSFIEMDTGLIYFFDEDNQIWINYRGDI